MDVNREIKFGPGNSEIKARKESVFELQLHSFDDPNGYDFELKNSGP